MRQFLGAFRRARPGTRVTGSAYFLAPVALGRSLGLVGILCLAAPSGLVAGTSSALRAMDVAGPGGGNVVIGRQTIQSAQSAAASEAESARRAYRRQEYKTAFPLWSELAGKGDPDDQNMLGVM